MHRRYPSIATAITALIAQACGLVSCDGGSSSDGRAGPVGSTGQAGGGASSIGGSSSAGTISIGLAGTLSNGLPPECAAVRALFVDQVVREIGQQRVFYSWTTDEQVAELRDGVELFSRSERPGEGRGLLFTELAAYAMSAPDTPGPATALAEVLVNQIFAKARFAWTNPWATLLGFPGESYGDQLLEVVLKPEAWIAHFDERGLSVYDVQNRPVPLGAALATPERIGAIYYQSQAEAGTTYCGTFSHGAVGFREFALGNIEMVERWSLATPEITERIERDMAELSAFQEQLNCLADSGNWSSDVACGWGGGSAGLPLTNYDLSLGLPSELYRPDAGNLDMLLAALEASKPTGEPLVVTPGQ